MREKNSIKLISSKNAKNDFGRFGVPLSLFSFGSLSRPLHLSVNILLTVTAPKCDLFHVVYGEKRLDQSKQCSKYAFMG